MKLSTWVNHICTCVVQVLRAHVIFFLWGKLKHVVYGNNPYVLEALKQNIHEAIYNIQQCELQPVSQNLFERIQACLTAEGRHFEHLL
jgi:hypothetical protein